MNSLFRNVRLDRKRGAEVALHTHEDSQLIYAVSGTMQVHTVTGRWLVPPGLAAWIPTSMPHRVEFISNAELWLIYWSAQATTAWAPPGLLKRAFALGVTPLLRELLDAATASRDAAIRTELVVRLVLQELTALTDAPTYLPLPHSETGRRIAERILADPCCQRSLDDLATDAATSTRNISRLFPAEIGQTFKSWRQRARIAFAVERLSSGIPIKKVADEIGFSSAAAFAVAFRQVTLMTPTEFQGKTARLCAAHSGPASRRGS
ncbi:helix-turn-helix transcriptional regulator [Burkholderia cepacia]|nr:helix-turn-helix transcriptional regulator [Burkholderia cepacia]